MRLSWIHLSDIHFGQGKGAVPGLDRKLVLARLLDDVEIVKSELGAPDHVFLTGDVAHSGRRSQYEEAKAWLGELVHRLGIGLDRLFVVPGNHDVDRDRVTGLVKVGHDAMRRDPELLSNMLDSGEIENLWGKLEEFQSFSSGNLGSADVSPEAPCWSRRLGGEPAIAYAVGLNTALQCYDDGDDKQTDGVGQNLQLSRWQLDRALASCPKDALALVLAHHPPELLADGGELLKELAGRAHVLLCGHVHQQGGFAMLPLGQHGHLRLVAGAGHSAGGEGTHAYAWGLLTGEGFDYFPRQWDRQHNTFLSPSFDPSLSEVKTHRRLGFYVSYPRRALPGPLRDWLGRSETADSPGRRITPFEPLPFRERALSCTVMRQAGHRLCKLVGRSHYDPDVLLAMNQGGLVVAAAMMEVWHNARISLGSVFWIKHRSRPYQSMFISLPGKVRGQGPWERVRPERILVVDTKFKSGKSTKAAYEFLRQTYGDEVEIQFAVALGYGGWPGRWRPPDGFPWPAELFEDDRIRAYLAFSTDRSPGSDDVPEAFRPGWTDEI